MCVRAHKCMLPIYILQTYITIAGRNSRIIFPHDRDQGGLLFIPCRELSQLGKAKIIFKRFLVGDNYLSGKVWKPLAETISPLQVLPRKQLLPKKDMLQNDRESR